jgi:hypothetical protein
VTAGPGEDDDPAFSPDGERIAFVRWDRQPDGPPRAAIFVVGPDGGGVTRLTSGPVIDSGPAWSPDGAEIAFTRVRFRGHQPRAAALHVMAADGTRVRRLGEGGEPAWSPDGRRLAFVSLRDRFGQTCFHDCIPSGEIYTMDPDGTGIRRLTRTRAQETAPAWSPDGGQIVFSSDRSDPARHDYELYVMSADGGCVTRLTNASSWSHEPAWQPGGGRAPCARDGIAPGARRPLVDTDLAPARAFTAHRLFYLGRTFRGLLLSYASGNAGADFTFAYDNCGRTRPAACPPSVQVQNRPLCDRPPAPERATLRRARERGAPVVIADHAGEEVTADVLTADAAVRVIADTHADVRRALAALRPLDESLGRRLPPPHRC